MKHYVVVAGNIGSGKSTLCDLLSQKMGWRLFLEPEADNPFLEDFYADMARWSFHSQIFFLNSRLVQHLAILRHPGSVIQDRCIYEDAEIFARNLFERGEMPKRDYDAYQYLYKNIKAVLTPPDLILYLRASAHTLRERIRQRGRRYEQAVPLAYLHRLNQLYDEWAANFGLCPVTTIDTEIIDFPSNPTEVTLLMKQIHASLTRDGGPDVTIGQT